MLGLKTHKLDFEILPTSNPKIILFLDESSYFEKPELPMLTLIPPGTNKYFQVNIQELQINVLNSHLIGYTDVLQSEDLIDLPDGIWELTYLICPYNYLYKNKYYLRTVLLENDIACIYNSIDISEKENSSCFKKDLLDIHLLLESAKANALKSSLSKANKDFSIAQKKVKILLKEIDNK